MNRKATWTRVKGAKVSKPKPRKPVRKVSKSMAKKLREYYRKKAFFMSKPENYFCRACKDAYERGEIMAGLILVATDCHHSKGRGKHLLDETTYVPLCRPHHDMCKSDPRWALRFGYNQLRLAKE